MGKKIFTPEIFVYLNLCYTCMFSEGSGSVVECLTQDQGAAGQSLTDVTALCPIARTLILAQYWFNQGRPVPL